MSNNSLEIKSLREVSKFSPIDNFNQEVFKNYHDLNFKKNQLLFGNFADNFPAITISLQSKKHHFRDIEDNIVKTSQQLADIDKINRKLLAIDDEEIDDKKSENHIIVKNNNQTKQLIIAENNCQLTKYNNNSYISINNNKDDKLLSKIDYLPKPNTIMIPKQEKVFNSLLRKKEVKSKL